MVFKLKFPVKSRLMLNELLDLFVVLIIDDRLEYQESIIH